MVHATVLRDDQDPRQIFPLPCCSGCEAGCQGKANSYHCPICPASKFKPTRLDKVQAHLVSHFSGSKGNVHLRGYKITGCPMLCPGYKETDRVRTHFHCPFCPRTFTKKNGFTTHLAGCGILKDNSRSTLTQDLLDIEGVSTDSSTSSGSSTSTTTQEEPGIAVSSTCPHCNLKFHPKSLRRHIRLKHETEKNQEINQGRHHFSVCVDASRGVYCVARNLTGPRYPIHVVKRTIGPSQEIQCDVRECMELAQIQWRSGNASHLCEHLQSVPYSVAPIPCDLDLSKLQAMVSGGFLRANRQQDCASLYERAKEEYVPLLVKIPTDSLTSRRYTFFSVYTDCTSWWCKSERTVVTLDTSTSTIACRCRQKGCLHRAIVKWSLFEEGRSETTEADEEDPSSEPVPDGQTVNYPPTGEPLRRMMSYLVTNKAIPLDVCRNQFDPTEAPSQLIPPETTCSHCSGTLSDPKVICRRAKIVHNTCHPITGIETFYKECLECHTPYRYQEFTDGVFNFNDRLFVTHNTLMEIRAGLVNHTAVSRTVKALCYRLDIELDLMDMENAYLAFEAMQCHEYDFSCVLCGHHPKILVHDLTKKAVFDYEVSSVKAPANPDPEVDVDEFWTSLQMEILARGIVRDQPNPFKLKPNFTNWAPYMGPNTRAGRKMYNTEYLKLNNTDPEDHSPVPEDLINRLLHEEKVDTLKRFCRILGISQKGSRLDLLCRLREQSMTKSAFDHAYAALHSHSGGWLSSTCPHNVTYAVKFLLRAESPRDYCDILRSMRHVPTVNICDIAHNISKMAEKVISPGFFRPNNGRLVETTEENVQAALEKRLEVSMPFLADDRPVTCENHQHPITGNDERYMLFDWFHETNTNVPEESLRRSSLVRELKGIVNTQAAEQLHRDKARDTYFQNQMSPSNHIFTFRLLAHLKNEMTNTAVRKRTLKHIPDVKCNPLGQLVSADSVYTECPPAGPRTAFVKPRKQRPARPPVPNPTEAASTTTPRAPPVTGFGTDILYLHKVRGDGNCFFRSVGYCATGFREEDHPRLRQLAYEWCDGRAELDITPAELGEIHNLGHPVGDHACTALSNVLRAKIVVWYRAAEEIESRVFQPLSGDPTEVCHLYFHMHGHYDALSTTEAANDTRWVVRGTRLTPLDSALPPNRKRKPATTATTSSGPTKRRKKTTAFLDLPPLHRQKTILTWLLDDSKVTEVINGTLVEEKDVETIPDAIPNKVLDDLVDLNEVRHFFTDDAWCALEHLVHVKRRGARWTCRECSELIDDGHETSVVCEACLEWCHTRCCGYSRMPKAKKWFCNMCQ